VKGGIPLNDSSMIGIISCMIGDKEFSLLNCWFVDCENELNSKNSGMVIIQYII